MTSRTLAFLANNHSVRYMPVSYRKGIGKSKSHPIQDTAKYGSTVFGMEMYCRPVRVFFPVSVPLGVTAVAAGWYDLVIHRHTLRETRDAPSPCLRSWCW